MKQTFEWHETRYLEDNPKQDGYYLCKCYDAEYLGNSEDDTVWSEPYIAVIECIDSIFNCDSSLVVAWAEIPTCDIKLEM